MIYKLVPRSEWDAALATGAFLGSAVDLADGFIHFSNAVQVTETARRYFAGAPDLMVLAVRAESLGAALKWEPSRGGDLFPHLYGPLDPALVIEARPAPQGPNGLPDLGDLSS